MDDSKITMKRLKQLADPLKPHSLRRGEVRELARRVLEAEGSFDSAVSQSIELEKELERAQQRARDERDRYESQLEMRRKLEEMFGDQQSEFEAIDVEEVILHDLEFDPRFEGSDSGARAWAEHLRSLTMQGSWRLQDVDPDEIDNPTYDEPSQEQLRRVFEFLKRKTPPPRVLLEMVDGRYVPINGSHRCAAARIKGESVPAYVLTPDQNQVGTVWEDEFWKLVEKHEVVAKQRDKLAYWVTQIRRNPAAPSSAVSLAQHIVAQDDYAPPEWANDPRSKRTCQWGHEPGREGL